MFIPRCNRGGRDYQGVCWWGVDTECRDPASIAQSTLRVCRDPCALRLERSRTVI